MRPFLLALSMVAPVCAEYALPSQHQGMRDIALVYRGAKPRQTKELAPLVAHVASNGRPDAWLFDAFLLLPAQGLSGKANFHNGPSTWSDWAGWLDAVFSDDGLLAALSAAVSDARGLLGEPASPHRVIISIPYPVQGQTGFGLSGVSSTLAGVDERFACVQRFVDQALEYWSRATIANLQLWGFYWHRETVQAADEKLVGRVTQLIHGHDKRCLWIPWFRATGFQRWREFGFDLAIMQPNYAFRPLVGGHLPDEGRLAETAALARRLGMGVEVETKYALDARERERALLRLYLNHAVSDGWQNAVRAHFFSFDQYQRLARSDTPAARELYDDLLSLHRGALRWRECSLLAGSEAFLTSGEQRGARVEIDGESPSSVSLPAGQQLEWRLTAPKRLNEVRLLFADRFPRAVDVHGREDGEQAWRLLASSTDAPQSLPGWSVATWPTRELSRLRVECPSFGNASLVIRRVASYPGARTESGAKVGQRSGVNVALGFPYVALPHHTRRYPDSGGELTDGRLTVRGFSDGRTVGWTSPRVQVTVDLGDAHQVTRVRAHMQVGGSGGVYAPQRMSVAGASDGAHWRLLHAQPCTLIPAATIGRDPEARLAWLVADAEAATDPVRWVRLELAPRQWLMLSEVEVWSGGVNVALGKAYTIRPQPRSDSEYADDGIALTDGIAEPRWSAAVGWNAGEPTIELRLRRRRRLRAVRVYVLGGGHGGVHTPARMDIERLDGGDEWRIIGTVTVAPLSPTTAPAGKWVKCLLNAEELSAVRIRLHRRAGWVMVGEVELIATDDGGSKP